LGKKRCGTPFSKHLLKKNQPLNLKKVDINLDTIGAIVSATTLYIKLILSNRPIYSIV